MPPGSRLSGKLMEGATLGRPLTDRCQPRAFVKRAPSQRASSLTAVKDDDTGITHSVNADTHMAHAHPPEPVTLWGV